MQTITKKLHLNLIQFILLSTTIITTASYQVCNITNELTPYQNTQLSNFINAQYIPYDQQQSLRTAYKSLNRNIDNYFIQIDQTYQFDINDIEECQYIPSYVTFNSMDNLWICMQHSVMLLKCNKEWELKIGCGTFIELHKPFDTQVIAKIMLSDTIIQSNAFSMTLVNLCAGTYHLWFVYSVRVGKIIKNVKPIFVSYPPCPCS